MYVYRREKVPCGAWAGAVKVLTAPRSRQRSVSARRVNREAASRSKCCASACVSLAML